MEKIIGQVDKGVVFAFFSVVVDDLPASSFLLKEPLRCLRLRLFLEG
jgi:hypothetical protein